MMYSIMRLFSLYREKTRCNDGSQLQKALEIADRSADDADGNAQGGRDQFVHTGHDEQELARDDRCAGEDLQGIELPTE